MKPMYLQVAALIGGCLMAAAPAVAGEWLQWQNNSLSYLDGRHYTVNPGNQRTLTVEHANAWKYGDTFAFVDITAFSGKVDPGTGSVAYYGEFAPRFSLGKATGRVIGAGPVTDVLLATAYEFGEGDVETWLIGPGVDLQVPGLDYLQLNLYRRHPQHGGRDHQWQVTPAWAWTVPLGRSDLLVDGFIDWVVDNGRTRHAHLHFNPQVKYDLGKALGWGAKVLYVGFEYDYWKNKYGIDDDGTVGRDVFGGTDQNTASLLLKAHLP